MTRLRNLPPGLFALALALASCTRTDLPPSTVRVTFNVTVPGETPPGAGVSIIGNHPSLGNDTPPGLVLDEVDDTRFSGAAELPPGETFTFHVRLTSPAASELDENYAPVTARQLTVLNRPFSLDLAPAHWKRDAPPGQYTITFLVTVPADTPPGDPIWISGNQEALGNWNGHGVQLARRPDGRFVAQVAFPAGTRVEWKVTRGSWDTVEKGPNGEEVPNHELTVGNADATTSTTVTTWRDRVPNNTPSTLTGNIKLHRDFASTHVKKRDIIVYLPPDYEANTARRYPVLYMHDGQNLMNRATAFAGVEWGVDEKAESLIAANEIEPLIIVGVYNTSDRIAEYTHVADSQYGGGNADEYGRFLVEELKPFIDANYRTRPEAQYTGLAGSSLGGLVSMYFGLTLSNTFTRIGVVSPSVFWANRDIVNRVNSLTVRPLIKVWEDMGTDEGDMETIADARLLRDALVNKGWVLDVDLKYLEVEGGKHNEAAWAARVDQILMYLYPPQPTP